MDDLAALSVIVVSERQRYRYRIRVSRLELCEIHSGYSRKLMKIYLAVFAGTLVFAGAAKAALVLNGSFAASSIGSGATYTSSSLKLDSQNVLSGSTTGDFTTLFPDDNNFANGVTPYSFVTATTATISGIGSSSTHPTSENIVNFFQLTSDSTPANRFDYALTSLYYQSPGKFYGNGIIHDSTGVYEDTYASVIISYSGVPGNYSYGFTMATGGAVPEPGAYAGLAGALAVLGIGAGAVRNRRNSRSIQSA
jgi:hypothetical protein